MKRQQRERLRRCITRGHDVPDPSTLPHYSWGDPRDPYMVFRCTRCGRNQTVDLRRRPTPPPFPADIVRDVDELQVAVEAVARSFGPGLNSAAEAIRIAFGLTSRATRDPLDLDDIPKPSPPEFGDLIDTIGDVIEEHETDPDGAVAAWEYSATTHHAVGVGPEPNWLAYGAAARRGEVRTITPTPRSRGWLLNRLYDDRASSRQEAMMLAELQSQAAADPAIGQFRLTRGAYLA